MSKELVKRFISSIILIPLVLFFILKGSFFFIFFLTICFFICVFEWHKMTKNKLYKISGLIFLLLSFYTIYKLRNEFNENYVYLLLVTTICVSTDIGGFLFGKIFKGPKITKISPNKTYSGMIGSFLLSVFSINFLLEVKYLNSTIELTQNLLIFTILVSTVSQIGDITISYFKRRSNIKDTGKIIPGHGGLLDRIDGMVFAFPFSYFLILTNILI